LNICQERGADGQPLRGVVLGLVRGRR
jgi:hypothetical protein